MKRKLFIDLGTIYTGISVFINDELVHYELIHVGANKHKIERYIFIRNEISKVIEKFQIEKVIIEDVALGFGARTTNPLISIQAIVQLFLYEKGIEFELVHPMTWKSYLRVTNKVAAEGKAATIEVVNRLYDLQLSYDKKGDADIADSLGMATYYNMKGETFLKSKKGGGKKC